MNLIEKQLRALEDPALNIDAWKASTVLILVSLFGKDHPSVQQIENIKYSFFGIGTGRGYVSHNNLESCKKQGRSVLETLLLIEEQKSTTQSAEALSTTTDVAIAAMRMTIQEAARASSEEGKTSPKVAAAVVMDNKLSGVAFRGQLGTGDHAEYTLFEKVLGGRDVSGATLYTTLEPCTSRNKHKPCADWIIEKKISRVVVGMLDPNPRIYGIGCKQLRNAGIRVEYYPVDLRRELEILNSEFIAQYRSNPKLQGEATFNPLNNNGIYTIGHGDFLFELKFSQASSRSIYLYHDPPSINTIAIAQDHREFNEILDATVFDTSSRTRTLLEQEIAVLQNSKGHFAAVKILDVKDKSHGDSIDELHISYWIQENGTSSFA